jgi:hypothetical protein
MAGVTVCEVNAQQLSGVKHKREVFFVIEITNPKKSSSLFNKAAARDRRATKKKSARQLHIPL